MKNIQKRLWGWDPYPSALSEDSAHDYPCETHTSLLEICWYLQGCGFVASLKICLPSKLETLCYEISGCLSSGEFLISAEGGIFVEVRDYFHQVCCFLPFLFFCLSFSQEKWIRVSKLYQISDHKRPYQPKSIRNDPNGTGQKL